MLGKIWGYLGMNEDGQSQEVADTAATINGDTNPTMVQLPTPMPQPKYQPESEEEEEETDDDFEPDPKPAKTGGITVIPTEKLNKEPEQTIAQQQAIPQDPEHRIISQQPQLHVQQMQQVQQPPPQQQQQQQLPTVVQQPDLLQHQQAQMQQQIEQQQQPPQQQGLALAAKKSKVEIPAESEEEEEEEEEEETDDEEISPTQSQTINEPPRVPGFVLQHAVKSEANGPKNVTQAEIKPADNEKKNGLDIKIENKPSTELQQQSNYQSVGAQQEYQQPSIVESQTNLETEQQKQQLQQEQQNQQPKQQQEKQSKPTNFIQELRQRQHSPVNEIQAVEPERNTKEEQVRAEEEKLKHQERVEQTRRKQEETKSKQINIAQEAQRRQQEKQQQKQQQTQRSPATQAPPPVQQKSIPKFRQAEQERIEKQKQAEQQQQPLESQQRQQQSQSIHTSQKSIAPTEDDDEMNPYEKQNIAVRSAEAAVKSGALQPSVAANVPPSLEQRKQFQKPDQTKPQQQQQQSNQPQQQTEQPPPNQQEQRQPHHQQQSQQKVVPPPAQPKAETVPKFRQTNQNVAEKHQQQHQQQQEQMQAKQQAVQSFGSSKLSTGIIKENDDGRVSYAADKIPVPIAPPVPTHHSIQEFTPRFEAEAEMSSRTGRTGEHFSRLGSNYVASLKDGWREAIDAANREPGGPLDTAPAVKLQEFVPHSEGQNRGSADIGVGGSASSTSALFATAGVVSKVAPIWPPPEQENAHPKISNKFGFGPRQGGAMQDETSWMHGDDLGGRGGNAPWANPTKKPTLRRVTENVWPPPPSELGPRPEYVPEHIPEEEAWNPAGTTHVQRSKPVPPPVEQRAPKQWPPTNGTV